MSTRSHKLTGTSGGVLAYLTDPDTALDYYAADGLAFDRVWGKGAATLGIERGLTREQFKDLFHGRWNGEQLAKTGFKKVIHPDGTVETVETRTPMIDVVYGAPKSLAVLYVKASPELRTKLDEVLLRAAHAAHNAMEDSAKLARVPVKKPSEVGARSTKQQGSETKRVTADLIALPVVQYTARHTDESLKRGVPDPQIHVHVPIFTLCQVGDRWLTADEFGMKNRTNAKYRDAVFLGELARGLEGLGVSLEYNEFDRARAGELRWEVKDTDPELRRYWSTNNEKAWRIRREYEEKHGKPIDEVALGEILYKTRKHKTPAAKRQDAHPNWQLWRDDATRAGFRIDDARTGRPLDHDPFQAADRLRLRLLSANGLCRDDAVFDEESIRPAIARCAVGLGFSPAELDGCARALLGPDGRDLVLVRDANEPEHRLYTTRTMLQAEHDIAETRDRKAGAWVDITGRAGTGKSALTSVAVDALRSLHGAPIGEAISAALDRREFRLDDEQVAGVNAIVNAAAGADEVLCVSMAASTAERTGQKIAADAWGSIESVVSRIEKGSIKPSSRTLVVIEEAGQLDTLRMDRLLKAVGDARIVTLGDTRQLSAIGGAGWYADSLVRHGSIELTEVRRQKDPRDVEDYALVRDGRAGDALNSLQSRDRVHVDADDASRMGRVFHDYRGHRESGRLARDVRIVLDSSNQDVDTANRFVQRDRLSRGEISPQAVEVENEEQGRRWRLHENDQVIMLETLRVRGEDPVKNGTTGIVKRIDANRQIVRVKLDDGREVNVPATAAIGLGYAVHAQKYQGGECPIALCVPGRSTSRNSGYTMVTRGIDESHIYVSVESGGVDGLAQKWAVADEKESASAVLARVREEMVLEELPPARTDDLVLDDIQLDPILALDEVRELDSMLFPPDSLEQTFTPERLVEPSLDESLDMSLDRSIELE
jgi:hypothetical protein